MKSLKNIFKLFLKKIIKKKIFLYFLFLLLIFISVLNLWINKIASKEPAKGGEFYEIILGEKARLINPVLATTRIDKDLVRLVFSPLLKKTPEGKIIDNITSCSVDKSGTKYTLTLKDNIFFHNGDKMTIDDIFFTLLKIKDPEINSPLRVYLTEAKLKKINEFSLEITIPEENYYFKEILSDIYILPKKIWENAKYFDGSQNLSPIGSGPFLIDELVWNEGKKLKDLESIILKKNNNYWKGENNIEKINFVFFENLSDFKESDLYNEKDEKFINIFSTEKLDFNNNFHQKIIKEPVTFKLTIKNGNRNQFLKNYKIRKYIYNIWTQDEENIVKFKKELLNTSDFKWDGVNKLLKYKGEIISFSVIVGGNQDNFLLNITKRLEDKLKDYGIDLTIKVVDNNEYYNKLMERDYESIISGYKNDESDLIYYYHSSQKNFPGVNIAQFNSKKIDNILLELRKNISPQERKEKNNRLKDEIKSYYILLDLQDKESFYYLSKDIKDTNGKDIEFSENRFDNLKNWIIKYTIKWPF